MNKRITLTMKEIKTLQIISMLEEMLITCAEADEESKLSEKQVY